MTATRQQVEERGKGRGPCFVKFTEAERVLHSRGVPRPVSLRSARNCFRVPVASSRKTTRKPRRGSCRTSLCNIPPLRLVPFLSLLPLFLVFTLDFLCLRS